MAAARPRYPNTRANLCIKSLIIFIGAVPLILPVSPYQEACYI
jgi:hypothetical protein